MPMTSCITSLTGWRINIININALAALRSLSGWRHVNKLHPLQHVVNACTEVFWEYDPLKVHILGRKDVVWRIKRQIRCSGLGASLSEEPTNEKNEKKKPSKDNFTYTRVKNPWTHSNEILHDGRAPWHGYPCKVRWWSVRPFLCGWSRISGFPIDSGSRPYYILALPCQSVIFSFTAKNQLKCC